jgi:adenylosuccinate synthase
MEPSVGDEIRARGHEFGTVTGRPRRCGWLDAVALRRAVRIGGIDNLVVTKLDVLTGLRTVKVCTGYYLRGVELDDLPALAHEYKQLEPRYEEFRGWNEDLSGARSLADLPAAVRELLQGISKLIDCPVSFASVGPGREATIPVDPPAVVRRYFGSAR